ncbi:hypothetical protein L917_18945 [Phytophthora nicotianae]|uniref:Uncharacterized protein n=1 Tax=Phytophthora nicotianae TaxID=4792 RepID=W2K618_PHYNI|nr:hypothetical protein L917_18945 [Phytophthora nicotianae]
MHNMIVEDERHLRDSDRIDFLFDVRNQPGGLLEFTVSRRARDSGHDTIEQLIVQTSKLRNARAHARHRDDLIEHLWQLFKEIFQCTSSYATVMLVMSDSLRAVLAASDDATANPCVLGSTAR